MVATTVRTMFAQPDPDQVWAQHHRVVGHLTEAGLTDAADHLDQAVDEILTFTGFPKPHWRQIWSNNPQERLNKEIRRRTNVVGIFPPEDQSPASSEPYSLKNTIAIAADQEAFPPYLHVRCALPIGGFPKLSAYALSSDRG